MPAPPPLATSADYADRYGPGPSSVDVLLNEASSLVREESGQTITFVAAEAVALEGRGTALLALPERPVVAVVSVEVDGVPVASSQWRLVHRGSLRRLGWHVWPSAAAIDVVYSHGWDVVPEWIVGLVCSMVQRAVRPAAQLGVQAQTTGSQTVQYQTSLAGVNLWLTHQELDRIRAIGPQLVR